MSSMDMSDSDEAQAEAFAGTLFAAALTAVELGNIELGTRLGYYDALADGAGRTAAELADATGTVERYAREWLEQQAASGVLLADVDVLADARRFRLPAGHAHVLLDQDSEAYMGMAGALIPWTAKAVDIMFEEFRRGVGVEFGRFDLHDLQAAFTRPVFRHHLVQNWLPALPMVQARLDAGEPVRIAEVGCGEGEAALTIAAAYPNARVDGYDVDDASLRVARIEAEERGLSDRVSFELRDAGDSDFAGEYDLVLAIEMVHDVPDPVAVLRTMRGLSGTSGAVLVVDERTENTFTAPAPEMERFLYAFSPLHCLAVSMQNGGAGTGTVMRADTLRQYATQAGFARTVILDVEHPQFRLYQLM